MSQLHSIYNLYPICIAITAYISPVAISGSSLELEVATVCLDGWDWWHITIHPDGCIMLYPYEFFRKVRGEKNAMGIPLKSTRFLNNLMFTVLHGARSYELSCLTAYRFEKGLILFWMGLVGLKGLKGPIGSRNQSLKMGILKKRFLLKISFGSKPFFREPKDVVHPDSGGSFFPFPAPLEPMQGKNVKPLRIVLDSNTDKDCSWFDLQVLQTRDSHGYPPVI